MRVVDGIAIDRLEGLIALYVEIISFTEASRAPFGLRYILKMVASDPARPPSGNGGSSRFTV